MAQVKNDRETGRFRLWIEDGVLAPAVIEDEGINASADNNTFNLRPFSEVEALLAAWGYNPATLGWQDIDIVLWHHLYTLYNFFMGPNIAGTPGPLEWRANAALREHDHEFAKGGEQIISNSERDRLFDLALEEDTRNARWIAEYALQWLDTGLRLREATRER